MKFRTNYQPFDGKPVVTCDPKEGRTKSEFAAECDINTIMKRFEKTGVLPEMIKTNPQYGEFADSPSYQEALNLVIHSQEQFQGLPARVRERFANDPAKFLEFASDASNGEEMVRLGLATKRPLEGPSNEKQPSRKTTSDEGSKKTKEARSDEKS